MRDEVGGGTWSGGREMEWRVRNGVRWWVGDEVK